MSTIFLNSSDDIKKYYQNSKVETNSQEKPITKEHNNENYTYYGKVKHGCLRRISQIFQVIAISFFIPLLAVKPIRQNFFRKIKEIKGPNETNIYVLEQLQKIHPAKTEQPTNQHIDQPFKNPRHPPVNNDIIEPVIPQRQVQVEPQPAQETINKTPAEASQFLEFERRIKEVKALLKAPSLELDDQAKVMNFFSSLSDVELQQVAPQFIKDLMNELIAHHGDSTKILLEQQRMVRKEIIQKLVEKVGNNPKSWDIKCVCQLLFLSDHFKLNLTLLEKIPSDLIGNLVKNFKESFSENFTVHNKIKLANIITYCEKIEASHKERVFSEIVKVLETTDILAILKPWHLMIKEYKSMCAAMISVCQDISKINIILKNIQERYTLSNFSPDAIKEIRIALISSSNSIDPLIHILQFFSDNKIPNSNKTPIDGSELKSLCQRNMIHEFVKKADHALIKTYLNTCSDPVVYLALKKALVAENTYDQFLASLDETQQEMFQNVTEQGFQAPAPEVLNIKFHTQIIDKDNKQPIPFIILNMHKKENGCSMYQLKRTDRADKEEAGSILGTIYLKKNGDHIYIYKLTSNQPRDKKGRQTIDHNIGRALHEFAIGESFRNDFEGNVRLNADPDQLSDLVHFKSGFRYVEKLEFAVEFPEGPLKELIKRFLKAKMEKSDFMSKLKKIEHIVSEYNTYKNKAIDWVATYGEDANAWTEKDAKTGNVYLAEGIWVDYMKRATIIETLKKTAPDEKKNFDEENFKKKIEGMTTDEILNKFLENSEESEESEYSWGAKSIEDINFGDFEVLLENDNENGYIYYNRNKLAKLRLAKAEDKISPRLKQDHILKNYGGAMYLSQKIIDEEWKKILGIEEE